MKKPTRKRKLTKTETRDVDGYTSEERREILARMQAAASTFYAAAVRAGCHAFIEFTGLMNEFIKLCSEAEANGIPWVQASVHGPDHLPWQPYHLDYLSEKLECIYGVRLDAASARPSSSARVA